MTSGTSSHRSLVALLALVLAGALAALVPAAAPAGAAGGGLRWVDKTTGSEAQFRGLAPVSRKVAWVSGTEGTVLRTTDGGKSWKDVSPGGDTGELEFRDIEAWDAKTAVIMSIGTGGDSRIYRTSDGGKTWRLGFKNANKQAFYDCIGFWDKRHGLAMSDPVNGKFRILVTKDGGRSWDKRPSAGMPAAIDGEFGFAASGTCLVTAGKTDAWIAGGGAAARVFHTEDRGLTWTVVDTPMVRSDAGGIFSLAVRDVATLVAVGGDFEKPDKTKRTSAYSDRRRRRPGRSARSCAATAPARRTCPHGGHRLALAGRDRGRADRHRRVLRRRGHLASASTRATSTASSAPRTAPAGPPAATAGWRSCAA